MRTAQKIAAIEDALPLIEDIHDGLRELVPAAASLLNQVTDACMDKLKTLREYQDEEAREAELDLAAEHRTHERSQ